MTFKWTGNMSTVTDEDIKAIVDDMRDAKLELTYFDALSHLLYIDPEGTLNIGAIELVERARELGS